MRECQFSNKRIDALLINEGRVIGRALNNVKYIVKRVEELGVPRGSRMFYRTFRCLCRVNADIFDAKIKLLGSLGFSGSELSAILKQPLVFCLSAKNLCETVDFLVKVACCELSYVSRHASMIGLSITKILIPRHYVMQLIMDRGLLNKKIYFYFFVSISERKFLEKFISSFQQRMPKLADVYFSASVGKFLY
ncbi:hypothetical protein KSP39_PZI016342 [Platanthera zijinensis]|uniref:Uncharacterized protein n=1 Tax=Platanthera zijinensis TaxID=2320716 RepID=A0AAP0B7S0_9ASPA